MKIDLKKLSNKKLQNEIEIIEQQINDIGCFGMKDLIYRECLYRECNRRKIIHNQ